MANKKAVWVVSLSILSVVLFLTAIVVVNYYMVGGDGDEPAKPEGDVSIVPADNPFKLPLILVSVALGVLIIIFIIGAVYVFKFIRRSQKPDPELIPRLKPARAWDLFTRQWARQYRMAYTCEPQTGQLLFDDPDDFLRLNEDADVDANQSESLIVEFVQKTGIEPGIHTVTIPLSRGEEWLREGGFLRMCHKPLEEVQKRRLFKRGAIAPSQVQREAVIEQATEQGLGLREIRESLRQIEGFERGQPAPESVGGFSKDEFLELQRQGHINGSLTYEDFLSKRVRG